MANDKPVRPAPAVKRLMKSLPLGSVKIEDAFWSPRQAINRSATLPCEYKACKETGRIDAFGLQWKPGQPNQPHIYWDSDVAKWIEAAAYSLMIHPDDALLQQLNDVADLVASSGQADGYLNSHYTTVEPDKRWTNLRDHHELYSAGHLMEAAVAHWQATGSRTLLDALCRYADHIDRTFGHEEGKKRGYCGHPEVELALVRLYEATGEERYLKLAKYFIDERGSGNGQYYDDEARARGEDPKQNWSGGYVNCQADRPIRQQTEAKGHAVRAFYLYSGAADVAAATGDEELLETCRRIWRDVTQEKMYVTGGIGPSAANEGFTSAYDLPNHTAYAETCAAIALVFFAHRMLQIEADSQYADVMERCLYNGTISGVSLDGTEFFYVNPLAALPDEPGATASPHHRQDWFWCACCPPNIARLVASLGQYVYSTSESGLYVHLYVAGTAQAQVAGQQVTILQETKYPWDGDIRLCLSVERKSRWDLMLRIPGWFRKYKLYVNGKATLCQARKGYARLARTWSDGDTVRLVLDMPVERVAAHPFVLPDGGRVALQRGPLVYCLEGCDNKVDLRTIVLPDRSRLTARWDGRLLSGAMVIEADALATPLKTWAGRLYQPADRIGQRRVRIKAIPYCLWDNRRRGGMAVFLPRA